MTRDSQDEPLTAAQVCLFMDLAISACRPSDEISSHHKGAVLALLQRLKEAEILRVVQAEAEIPRV